MLFLTNKPQNQRKHSQTRQRQMNSVRIKVFFVFLFFLNLCSWYYFFCMECCLNRQQIKGKIHSTCQAHATEATGSRQSFFFLEERRFFCIFTCSAFYNTILHILRVPYSPLAKRQSKFYSVLSCKSVKST